VAFLVAVLLAVFVVPAPWNLAVVAAGGLVEAVEAWAALRWARRLRARVAVGAGVEALVGAEAEVVDARFVRVAGELWQARNLEGRRPGERVRVARVDGLTLEVE
jgi:membrane-bound serine protease (ClpP class)